MYLYQYICMAAFVCLLFNRVTRLPAATFLTGWLVYSVVYTIDVLPSTWYYAFSATIETAIGYALNRRFRIVSYLSYSLIFVNLFGLYLYVNKIQADSYDIIYAIITILQLLLLIFRGLLNGVNSSYTHIFVVRFINFDSGYTRDKM